MVAKPLTCARCGGQLGEPANTGRPARYCGDLCKRLVEFELRRLDRRISGYESQLREELADRNEPDHWIDNLGRNRTQRVRDLRRWLKVDQTRLEQLLAGNAPPAVNATGQR